MGDVISYSFSKAKIIVGFVQILDSFLGKVKYARRSHELDVREKLIYERINEPPIRICTDGYDIAIDGKLIKHNDGFVMFLRSMTL